MRLLATLGALVATCLLVVGVPRPQARVSAGTAVRMSVPELTRNASLILEGHVLASQASASPDGRVETEYLLQVERTFRGEDLPYRSIRIPGGVLPDGSGMVLAGMPTIADGEDVLLFLTGRSRGGVRMPVGLAQGKFRVVHQADGTKVLEREGGGVSLLDPRTGALQEAEHSSAWSYADVVAQIEAALERRR